MFSELFVLAHGEVNQIPCFGYLSIVFHVLDILYSMFWIFCIPCFGYFVFHVLDICIPCFGYLSIVNIDVHSSVVAIWMTWVSFQMGIKSYKVTISHTTT